MSRVPSNSDPLSVDCVVVGAGVIGCAVSRALARRFKEVHTHSFIHANAANSCVNSYRGLETWFGLSPNRIWQAKEESDQDVNSRVLISLF